MVTATLPTVPAQSSRELLRSELVSADALHPFSAAGLQASRLAACADGTFVFASGQCVFTLDISAPRKRPRASPPANSDVLDGNIVTDAIADDYIVPRALPQLSPTRLPIHCAHGTDVQSVTADGARIASVDALGHVVVTLDNPARADTRPRSFTVPPASLSTGEPGWAGVALRANDDAGAAVARQFFRDVTLFDRDVPVRTFNSLAAPAALGFAGSPGSGDVVAVAEGADVALYDARSGEGGGCVARKNIGASALLAMDVSLSGMELALAGMERVLHVFDIRMVGVRDRWSSCLKYECAATLFNREVDGLAYVCSIDNEISCGAWSSELTESVKRISGGQSLMMSGANTKSPRRAYGFRADVRIIGMARRDVGGEQIGALTESGAFYLLRAREDAVLEP